LEENIMSARLLVSTLALAAASSVAFAQPVYEGFEYGLGSTGPFNSGTGFAAGSAWERFDDNTLEFTTTMFPQNIVPGLSYTNIRPLVVKGAAYSPGGFQGITRSTANQWRPCQRR
jgi:hypothetical protein